MEYKNKYNVFVGARTGRLIGVRVKQIAPPQIENMCRNLISTVDHHDITCMSWGDNDEKEILLGCGVKEERSLKTFNRENQKFTSSFVCNSGKGPIKGTAKCNGNILISLQSGHILLNNCKEECILDAGENVMRMRQSELKKNIIATGGEENPLKLFDLETKTNVFTAKNVPHDSLQLRVPVSINDLCFFENNEVATIGKYGHVRVYDSRKQRRPVVNFELKEQALTTLTTNFHREKELICGTGTGRIFSIDIRKAGKVLKTYKGPVGAVTALAVSKVDEVIVSTSLDRHLYVHDINSNILLKKVYLELNLNSMVLASEFSLNEIKEEDLKEEIVIDDVDMLHGLEEECYSDDSELSAD